METRELILERVRRAGARLSPATRMHPATQSRPRSDILEQFGHYVREYKAKVHNADMDELPFLIDGLVDPDATLLAPSDLPRNWITDSRRLLLDDKLSHRQLDGCDAVITGAAVGIAETGTVALDGGATQGRRAITLIPDHHLCVLFESQVVDSVPEGIWRLGPSAQIGRPITFISGPSATSDIELCRVEGVHGPRRLDILLVKDPLDE